MNTKLVMAVFIIFVMVSSIFGFIFGFGGSSPGVQKIKYGDFKFRVVNDQYITKINGQDQRFLFFPGDVEYIAITGEVKSLLDQPALTVTYNPKSGIAENLAETQYYFESQLKDKSIERALTDSEGTSLPQKSCADATQQQPVILLKKGDLSSIETENSCIIITALDSYDLYQQVERIIYVSLGVMQ